MNGPTREIAARIQRLIDELQTGLQWGVNGFCKDDLNALPLWETEVYAWVLQTDGGMLCLDKTAHGYHPEPVNDQLTYYAVLAQGARRYPDLQNLVPTPPRGVMPCRACEASGWIGSEACFRCLGLGFTSTV